MTLDEDRVWLCGDWHGNVGHLQRLLPALRRAAPGVKTILHLGDWWTEPRPIDYWAEKAGIERVLVTLGNHEPWSTYSPLLAEGGGAAVRISEVTWLLPRPFRFRIGGRSFLSVGGAASIDREWRREGVDWWPEEEITDQEVCEAIRGGAAEVMVSHETPEHTPVPAVRDILDAPSIGVSWVSAARSATSRAKVQHVWDATRPALLAHGHLHVFGSGRTGDGRRVLSLARDDMAGNAVLLELSSLKLIPL